MSGLSILEANLERLYQQTIINSDYDVIEKKTPPTITKNMNLGTYPIYNKTSQLESSMVYNGDEQTQQYMYPPLKVAQPPPRYSSEFNYAYDQYITKKPIDVSGTVIPNNELRVKNNRGTSTLYRPQIINKNV